MTIYCDDELDLAPLRDKTVAVLGYGNQGHAHALNLRDSGLRVVVGQRREGQGFGRAQADGFEPCTISQAVARADLVIVALPDSVAPEVYDEHIAPHICPGRSIGFIHGYNVHFKRIVPRPDVDVVMVAPKGAGYMVRRAYVAGGGLACLAASHQDITGQAWPTALAWAKGIGAGRAGVLESSFAAETETDLFGEQVSVVGGVTALMKTAFETLVEAGYEPEHAYFECVHEVKYVVDLIHDHGLSGMRGSISDTARYGGLTRDPRLAEAVRPVMQQILEEIRGGRFAEEWAAENRDGRPKMKALERKDQESLLEQTGKLLRQRLGDRSGA